MGFIDDLIKERDNLAKDLARCDEELQATKKEVKILEGELYKMRKKRDNWRRVADSYAIRCEKPEEWKRDNWRPKLEGNGPIIDWDIKTVKHRDDESAKKAPYIIGYDMSAEHRSQETATDTLYNNTPMMAAFRYFLDLQTEKDDVASDITIPSVEDKAEPKWDVLREYNGMPIMLRGISYSTADNSESSKKPAFVRRDFRITIDKLDKYVHNRSDSILSYIRAYATYEIMNRLKKMYAEGHRDIFNS